MDLLQQWFEQSQWPVLSAFLLGLMTAISPCPLATNITAIGFIGKDIQNRRHVFVNGLIYTLGRGISYTALGVLLYFGASQFRISRLFNTWGEKLLGPLLVIIGLLMLDFIRINFPTFSRLTEKLEARSKSGIRGVLLLGIVFALAFCPYSGVLYFGVLIPMTVTSANGLILPFVFAIATGLPVIIFAWLIAFTLGSVSKFYNQIKIFEMWFRRVVAVIFILVGMYYIGIFFF